MNLNIITTEGALISEPFILAKLTSRESTLFKLVRKYLIEIAEDNNLSDVAITQISLNDIAIKDFVRKVYKSLDDIGKLTIFEADIKDLL